MYLTKMRPNTMCLYSAASMLAESGHQRGVEAVPLGSSAPTGWTYLNIFCVAAGGTVDSSGCAHTGSNCHDDDADQAYDSITQMINTTAGLTYNVNFWLNDDSGLTTFSSLSTNGDVDSKLRGCDPVALRVKNVAHGSQVAARAIVMQRKTTAGPVRNHRADT